MEQAIKSLGNGITIIKGNKASTNMETESAPKPENVENNQETPQTNVNKKDLAKVVNLKNIGMPVSGKPWKKLSLTANSRIKKIGLLKRTVQQKMEIAQEKRELRQLVKSIRDEENKKKEQRRLALEAKRKRKEENELKSSTFQLIKNTDKVRKWSKKARSQLAKLPSSMFEQVIKKEYGY